MPRRTSPEVELIATADEQLRRRARPRQPVVHGRSRDLLSQVSHSVRPQRARLWSLVAVWAVLAAALVGAGELVKQSSAVLAVDRHITSFVVAHRSDTLNDVMRAVTWAGTWVAALISVAVVTILATRRALPVTAVAVIAVGWLGEEVAVTLAKSLVQRPRPPPAVHVVVAHGWSFPSGHTANATVIFTAAAVLLTGIVAGRLRRTLIYTAAAAAVGLVAFSRVELGVHWTSDVVASALWAGTWLLVGRRTLTALTPEASGRSEPAAPG